MKLSCVCVLSALAFGSCVRAAHADEITFTFTLNDGDYPTITATFPDVFEMPFGDEYNYTQPVLQHIGLEETVSKIRFGGFDFVLNDFATRITASVGIFDSSEAVFRPGTYENSDLFNHFPQAQTGLPEGDYLKGTLVITEAAEPSSVAPEPSSFALLGTGMLGLAVVVRKRFVKQADHEESPG